MAGGTPLECGDHPPAVVIDVHPVADLHAVAGQWKREALHGLADERGNEGVIMWAGTVVVGGAGDDDILAVHPVCGQAEQVGGGLRSGVGRTRLEGGSLDELGGGVDRSVDRCGRTVEERHLARAAGVEQTGGAVDVGDDEVAGWAGGSIGVGPGGEMEDAGRGHLAENAGNQAGVADVPLDDADAGVLVGADEIAGVAGAGELVQDDEVFEVRQREEVADKTGADEAGASGDEDGSQGAHGGEHRRTEQAAEPERWVDDRRCPASLGRMELAVVGATGKLGRYLHDCWREHHRVHAIGRHDVDLRDPVATRRVLEDARFDVLVNCAAMSSPEACEACPEDARRVNAEAPEAMAVACRGKGARMLHFSTDYVLDGTEPGLKDEEAPTGPVNVYGRTKLEGEHRVLETCPTAAVCRVSWVFGTRPSGFLESILTRARNGEPLEAVVDKWSTPTCVREIRRVAEMLARRPDLGGVFHVTHGGEPESWWTYGRKVLKMAEMSGIIEEGWELLPGTMAEVPQLAVPRPVHTGLDPRRLVRELGWQMPDWETAAREEIGRLGSRECH